MIISWTTFNRKGENKLTDTKLLNAAIKGSGITISHLAIKIGITREAFYKKMRNETEFKASEIVALKKILNLSNEKRDSIFFNEKVE